MWRRLAGAAETLTGGAFQAACEQLAGLYEGAFPVVQAVRLNVAAAFELGEAFLNLSRARSTTSSW